MMNSREILEFITDNEKVTLSKLSQLMGIKRAQPLYDIRDGKIKAISANYADKILSVFPEYSRAWLITGEGQPFSKNKNEVNLSDLTKRFLEEVERMGVSFYNIAKSTGVQESMFTKIKMGIQEPSKKFLSKFAECFPDANMKYIYLGNEENADEDSIMATNAYSERFLQVIDKLEVTDYKVWNTLENLSKATMSKIRRGICGVSMNTLQEFCQTYNVNANYILTGKGNMFLDTDKSTSENIASQSQKMYKDTITGKDKEIANLKAEIERMKSEIDKLTGQNEIMREQLGLSGRKASTKSA
jgi:hypothetical protein